MAVQIRSGRDRFAKLKTLRKLITTLLVFGGFASLCWNPGTAFPPFVPTHTPADLRTAVPGWDCRVVNKRRTGPERLSVLCFEPAEAQ